MALLSPATFDLSPSKGPLPIEVAASHRLRADGETRVTIRYVLDASRPVRFRDGNRLVTEVTTPPATVFETETTVTYSLRLDWSKPPGEVGGVPIRAEFHDESGGLVAPLQRTFIASGSVEAIGPLSLGTPKVRKKVSAKKTARGSRKGK